MIVWTDSFSSILSGPVQNACSSPEPPMSPGMFEIITQHLSPFEFESAVSNMFNIVMWWSSIVIWE